MSKNKSWFSNWCNSRQRGQTEMEQNNGRLFSEFSLLAQNRFKWTNLPAGIESHHIERFLFTNGDVAFFEDNLKGFLALPCSPSGNLNVYGDALTFTVTGTNFSKLISTDDMVRIRSNDFSIPNILQVRHYTNLLDEIEKTSFMNLRQQRFPWIFATTKENELTVKNIFNKIENFEEAIIVDQRLTQGGDLGVKTMVTNTPYLLDNLREEKKSVMNELLSWLGLNNTEPKKERLLVDEVNVNNNHILMNLDVEFKHRQKACEEINNKFGLNVCVEKTIDNLQLDFHGQINEDNKKTGWFK